MFFFRTGDPIVFKEQFFLDPRGKLFHGQDVCSMLWKNSWALPHGAWMWGSHHLKGQKIYSLSLSLFQFYFIKVAIFPSWSLSDLLMGIQKESCTISTSHPPCSTGNSTYCRHTTVHAEQENYSWEDIFLSFKTICSLTISCIKFLQYFYIYRKNKGFLSVV